MPFTRQRHNGTKHLNDATVNDATVNDALSNAVQIDETLEHDSFVDDVSAAFSSSRIAGSRIAGSRIAGSRIAGSHATLSSRHAARHMSTHAHDQSAHFLPHLLDAAFMSSRKPFLVSRLALPVFAACAGAFSILQAFAKPSGVWGWTSGSQTYLRARPGAKTPAVAKVPRHTKMFVWGKFDGWYRVETPDHKFGWVFNSYIRSTDENKIPELSHRKARLASNRTENQTMYGSPALLRQHLARYGAKGAAQGLEKQGIRVAGRSTSRRATNRAISRTRLAHNASTHSTSRSTAIRNSPSRNTAWREVALASSRDRFARTAAPDFNDVGNVRLMPAQSLRAHHDDDRFSETTTTNTAVASSRTSSQAGATRAATPRRQKPSPRRTQAKPQPRGTQNQAAQAQQGAVQQRVAQQKLAQQKLAQQKLAQQKLVQQKLVQQRVAALAAQQRVAAQQRIAQTQAAQKRREQQAEQARLAQARLAQARLAQAREAEAARLAQVKKAEQQRLAQEKAARTQLAQERVAQQKLAQERLAERGRKAEAKRKLAQARRAARAARYAREAQIRAQRRALRQQRLAQQKMLKRDRLRARLGTAGVTPSMATPELRPLTPDELLRARSDYLAAKKKNQPSVASGTGIAAPNDAFNGDAAQAPAVSPSSYQTPGGGQAFSTVTRVSYSRRAKSKRSGLNARYSRGGSPRDYMYRRTTTPAGDSGTATSGTATSGSLFGQTMARQAMSYRGMPYISGANSPNRGFDCSGLIYYLLRQRGYNPPRTAAGMAAYGKSVGRGELQSGDLVLFSNTYKRGISHIGIYVGQGKFVHAANHRKGVSVDSLSSKYYASKYYGARRVK